MSMVTTLDPYAEFFARIWTLDHACPGCGTLFLETTAHRKAHIKDTHRRAPSRYARWTPLIGRFRCTECTATWIFGVVAWSVPFASYAAPPDDHVPKPWQQARIRELLGKGGFLMDWRDRQGPRDPANLVVTQPCSCRLEATGVVRDPHCAVHGRTRAAERERRDPEGTTRRFPHRKPPREVKPPNRHQWRDPKTHRFVSKARAAELAAGILPPAAPAKTRGES